MWKFHSVHSLHSIIVLDYLVALALVIPRCLESNIWLHVTHGNPSTPLTTSTRNMTPPLLEWEFVGEKVWRIDFLHGNVGYVTTHNIIVWNIFKPHVWDFRLPKCLHMKQKECICSLFRLLWMIKSRSILTFILDRVVQTCIKGFQCSNRYRPWTTAKITIVN